MEKIKKTKRWYWYLGLAILLLWLGIPQAVFKSVLYLAESLPRHAVVELAYVPLNLAEWLVVTTPNRIAEDPATGIPLFIGNIAVLGIGIWLMCRKPKNPKHT